MTHYTREQLIEAAASLRVFILAKDNAGFVQLAEMAGIPDDEIAAIDAAMSEARDALRELLCVNLSAYMEFQRTMAEQRQETPFDPRLYIDFPHPLLSALERERSRFTLAIAEPRRRYDEAWRRLVTLCEQAKYPVGFLGRSRLPADISEEELLELHGIERK